MFSFARKMRRFLLGSVDFGSFRICPRCRSTVQNPAKVGIIGLSLILICGWRGRIEKPIGPMESRDGEFLETKFLECF